MLNLKGIMYACFGNMLLKVLIQLTILNSANEFTKKFKDCVSIPPLPDKILFRIHKRGDCLRMFQFYLY